MDMCINDESFDGQFDNYDDAVTAIIQLAEMTIDYRCSAMRNNRGILTTRNLAHRLMTKEQTVIAIIQRMKGEYDPRKKEYARQLLLMFVKKPIVDLFQADDVDVSCNNDDVKQTALDAATVPIVRLAVISVSNNDKYTDEQIKVQLNGIDTNILNFTTVAMIAHYHWRYDANDRKHLPNKAVKFGKATASPMSLVGDAAQHALSNSLLVSEGLTYNIVGEQWFAFRAESVGVYHGYCIDALGGDKKFNKAKKLYNKLENERVGQIFAEYINW